MKYLCTSRRKFECDTDRRLAWRGVALDEFTGKELEEIAPRRALGKKLKSTGMVSLRLEPRQSSSLTAQRFFLEPVDTPALFGRAADCRRPGHLPFVRVDAEKLDSNPTP